MRTRSAVIGVAGASLFVLEAWVAGCSDLSNDCALNLTCVESAAASGGSGQGGGAADAGSGHDAGDASAACHGLFSPGACTTCLEGSCCAEIAACTADDKCFACYTGQVDTSQCHAPATESALQGIVGCQAAKCTEACAPSDSCNPVTNAGCTAAGSACDIGASGGFECFPPPNATPLCAACDPPNGKFCAGGMMCLFGAAKCFKYCCDDADCGTGTCWKNQTVIFGAPLALASDTPGICVTSVPDGGPAEPACDAPPTSPSAGSCVGGYSGK
jgi:hypothetical protein